jgi:hypothetical protein
MARRWHAGRTAYPYRHSRPGVAPGLGWWFVVEPPPESNRRPHPYHGTTRNRYANRHIPRSRPTVGVEVIGSLSAKLCVLFKPCADRRWSKPSSPVRDRQLSPPFPIDHILLALGGRPSDAGSRTGHWARTPRPVRPQRGSLWRRPQPATRGCLVPARHRPSQVVPVAAGPHGVLHVPDLDAAWAAAFATDPGALDQHPPVWLLVFRSKGANPRDAGSEPWLARCRGRAYCAGIERRA